MWRWKRILSSTAHDYRAYWLENWEHPENYDGRWDDDNPRKTTYGKTRNDANTHDIYIKPVVWLRLEESTTLLEGAENRTVYQYEGNRWLDAHGVWQATQFGNVTSVSEYGDGHFLGETVTEYIGDWWADDVYYGHLPSRVRVFSASGRNLGNCESETRMIYADSEWIRVPPASTQPIRIQRAIQGCASGESILDGNSGWAVTRYWYDTYGNLSREKIYGGPRADKYYFYDPVYHLFLTRVTVGDHSETAKYYGANGSAATGDGAFWGAMQERCGVNGVCIGQKYDQFGRTVEQWDNVSSARSYWRHDARGTFGADHKTMTVTQWSTPRCMGNLKRSHYNGLGQLVAEQSSYQNWKASETGGGWPDFSSDEASACRGVGNGVNQESHVIYAYNGLGEMSRASVPLLRSSGQFRTVTANWGITLHTHTQTDALGRVTQVTAPNGQVTKTIYGNRMQKVLQVGRYGDPSKWLQWVTFDGLGNPRLLYSVSEAETGTASTQLRPSRQNILAGTVLTHDVMGNLTQVDHNAFASKVVMKYDMLGRKKTMSDPDLGNWRYQYDRAGNLTRQTDACGNVTILSYDRHNLLERRRVMQGGNGECRLSGGNETIDYTYGTGGKSKGQLTEVKYTDGSYRKNLAYNSYGLLASETVRISGAPQSSYITRYGYDKFLQPRTVTYPDGEVVTTETNGMGLPAKMSSNRLGVLVDGNAPGTAIANSVSYDEAGRLFLMRLPKSKPDLWRHSVYYEWGGNGSDLRNGNGLLAEIRVGTYAGGADRLYLQYVYDSFANIRRFDETYNSKAESIFEFTYDDVNRVTRAYNKINEPTDPGQVYGWMDQGKMASFEGKSMTYDGVHVHAVKSVSGVDRYDYDANGNMIRRNKGLSSAQTLSWNGENRLVSVFGGGVYDTYAYAPDGQRVKKVSGDTTTYYINRYYEVEASFVPLAVSLAYFVAEEEGEQRHFVWRMATENGIAGFNILQDSEAGLEQLNEELIPATGIDTVMPQTYQFSAVSSTESFYLQEVMLDGSVREHGPFMLGQAFGAEMAENRPDELAEALYLPWVHGGDGPVAAAAVRNDVIIRKYYYFGGQRVAMWTNDPILAPFRYLHWDHLGSTLVETHPSSGNVMHKQGYYAFGSYRDVDASDGKRDHVITDHRFTGQKLDGSGLMYYNARYYDPEIGHFISPDTIVPDPLDPMAYNRYMYVLGNPVKFSDPSGHIAVCFRGGFREQGSGSSTEGNQDFWNACEQTLLDSGYNPEIHGEILKLKNEFTDAVTAAEAILAQERNNPHMPVIIAGHSWGGSAAILTANLLAEGSGLMLPGESATVDLLFTIDSVSFGRGPASRELDGDNVQTFVNAYVKEFEGQGPQNGIDFFEGAFNFPVHKYVDFGPGVGVKEVDHHNVSHYSSDDQDDVVPNPVTYGLLADYTSQALPWSDPGVR